MVYYTRITYQSNGVNNFKRFLCDFNKNIIWLILPAIIVDLFNLNPKINKSV